MKYWFKQKYQLFQYSTLLIVYTCILLLSVNMYNYAPTQVWVGI